VKLNDTNKTNLHIEDLLTFRLYEIEYMKRVSGKHWYSPYKSVLDKMIYCIELSFKVNTEHTYHLRASYDNKETRQKDYDVLVEQFAQLAQ
jgi:hypothetical protein